MTADAKKNFFVSYNKADKVWAVWVAWQLEDAGHTTIIQAWDFLPGSNFVVEMDDATRQAERTVAILSPDYLTAVYTRVEWAEAFRRDPEGKQRTLVPVRVRACEPEGLLGSIVYADLVDVTEEEARSRVLAIAGARAKPATMPAFPGTRSPTFPGAAPASAAVSTVRSGAAVPSTTTDSDVRLAIARLQTQDPELAKALVCCAVPRRLDRQIIRALMDPQLNDDATTSLLAKLAALPFVDARDGGVIISEPVRAFLLAEAAKSTGDAQRLTEYHRRMAAFYAAEHDKAEGLEQDLARVGHVIRRANRPRYARIAEVLDKSLLAPLLESLFHELSQSLERGYDFFTTKYQQYETKGRLRICEALIAPMRRAVTDAPSSPTVDKLLLWLKYWEARLLSSRNRYIEADDLLKKLELQAGDDVQLKVWVMGGRGQALEWQSKPRQARDFYERALALARDTTEDAFNRPVSHLAISRILWSLDELEEAERRFRDTIESARREQNRKIEVSALLSLSEVYQDLGDWSQSVDAAFEALHLVRSDRPVDYALAVDTSKRFMRLFARRDARLIDTLYSEARTLLDFADQAEVLELRRQYGDALREGGQLRRAAQRFGELWPEVTMLADVNLTIAVLFSRAALASDAGDSKACGGLLTEILEQQESGNLTEWQRATALVRRAEARIACGDLTNAEADATAAAAAWDAIGHDQQAALAQLGLAEIRRRQGRAEDGATLRGAYLASGRPAIRAEHQLAEGHAGRDSGNWRSAIEAYRKAAADRRSLNHLSDLSRVLTNLAMAAASSGDWHLAAESAGEAKAHWDRLSTINQYAPQLDAVSGDDDNARGLGYVCTSEALVGGSRYAGDPLRVACDAFRSAITRNERNVWYRINLAYCCARLADWTGAAESLDRALLIAREDRLDWLRSKVLDRRLAEFRIHESEQLQEEGDRSLAEGKIEDARRAFERALRLVPESAPEVHRRQGDLQARIGLASFLANDTRSSRTLFARALGLYAEGNFTKPGDMLGTVCRALLPGVTAYWALDAEWKTQAEGDRRDRTLPLYLADARHSLVVYLNELYRLSGSTTKLEPILPVMLELGTALIPADTGTETWALFTTYIPAMRQRIAAQTGVEVPGVRVRPNASLPPLGYALLLDEIPLVSGSVVAGAGFVSVPLARIGQAGLDIGAITEVVNPATGGVGCWVPADRVSAIVRSELEVWQDPLEFIVRHLEAVLRRHLADFVGVEETERLLKKWSSDKGPALVSTILPDAPARLLCSRLLGAMARQGVPILSWRTILRVMQSTKVNNGDLAPLLQAVRLQLRAELPGNGRTPNRIKVPAEWESRLAAAFRSENGRRTFQFPPRDAHEFLAAIRKLVMPWHPDSVLVCRRLEMRSSIQTLVAPEFPDLPVLAAEEVVQHRDDAPLPSGSAPPQ